jgi:copper chaperone NosL
MNRDSKRIMLIVAVLLLTVFLTPIWIIDLGAPQYPEGIGLYIWVNKITGINPNDLTNINMLNHYIGMKYIDSEAIPELKIFPYIIIFMSIFALFISRFSKRKMILFWIACIIVIGVAGLTDFYLWEYDYGHNLDPKAAIKIPGMSYQPPLIGTKQLLNMKTTSLPYIGSYIIGVCTILAFWAYWNDKKSYKVS